MRIDLSREITMQFLDELDDFLAMTRLGETWSEKSYMVYVMLVATYVHF